MKYCHTTKFLNQILKNGINHSLDKASLNFRLSLICLNQPVHKELFSSLYCHATNIIFCDGASNRVFDTFEEEERLRYLPTHIIGDLDSARKDVLDYYEQNCVKLIQDPDQDNNDFQK